MIILDLPSVVLLNLDIMALGPGTLILKSIDIHPCCFLLSGVSIGGSDADILVSLSVCPVTVLSGGSILDAIVFLWDEFSVLDVINYNFDCLCHGLAIRGIFDVIIHLFCGVRWKVLLAEQLGCWLHLLPL